MKLIKANNVLLVTPKEMPLNSIGIIRNWSVKGYIGKIVKKIKVGDWTKPQLISLANGDESYWQDCGEYYDANKYMVELLPSGTQLEI